jgi:hypothetical protein
VAITPLEALRLIVSETNKNGADEVEPGWMPSDQWAKQWNLSEPRTRSLLVAGYRSGVLEKKQFRINLGSMLRPVNHYRPVEAPKKRK